MADWNKLNKEFDDALNKMTGEEWNEFKCKCDEKRALSKSAVSICACGSNDYYTEVYKDITKYYCKKCHERIQ